MIYDETDNTYSYESREEEVKVFFEQNTVILPTIHDTINDDLLIIQDKKIVSISELKSYKECCTNCSVAEEAAEKCIKEFNLDNEEFVPYALIYGYESEFNGETISKEDLYNELQILNLI